MYITVKLLNGFAQPLTYKIPSDWKLQDLLYRIVRVPLQKREERAVIIATSSFTPQTSYTLKYALHLEAMPTDAHYQTFIKQVSAYYTLAPEFFYKRARQSLVEKEIDHDDALAFLQREATASPFQLTPDQKAIINALTPIIEQPAYHPTLIHGVTGSGKTEIYKKLAEETFYKKKTTILLLPEVSLAVHFMHILRATLPAEIPIFGFHSATPAQEKQLLWNAVCHHQPVIIVGVHLPIMIPLNNLGLIIIDEEHEAGFQEKKLPRVNTKEVALIRAQICQIPIILGSATPSVSSLYNVATRGWHFFELKHRVKGAFPTITRVPLMKDKQRPHFWISTVLHTAIIERLARNEQTLIFLNRRGFSFFIQCAPCGFVFTCHACSVSLTYHENKTLQCHYCNAQQAVPAQCPTCKAPEKEFLKKGIGTQQVMSLLQQLFPQARIARADADSTRNKKKWTTTLQAMHAGEIDILVGTQTITKGYHFPNVTLVGVIWADMSVHFPWYNAAEITLQQLIQVAGRAGRERPDSNVIVQTLTDHPIFNYLNEQDYKQFYTQEISLRNEVQYPPSTRFVEIELRHQDVTTVNHEAEQCAAALEDYAFARSWNIRVLGPTEPPVHKIHNIHVRTIYLKAPTIAACTALFQSLDLANYKSHIAFTPNPLC